MDVVIQKTADCQLGSSITTSVNVDGLTDQMGMNEKERGKEGKGKIEGKENSPLSEGSPRSRNVGSTGYHMFRPSNVCSQVLSTSQHLFWAP